MKVKIVIVPIFRDVGAAREIYFDEAQKKAIKVLNEYALLIRKSLYDFKIVNSKQYTLTYISSTAKVEPYGTVRDFRIEFTLPDSINLDEAVNFLKSELGKGFEVEVEEI